MSALATSHNPEAQQIAETILTQIGGRRALVMIGGKAHYGSNGELNIRFRAKARFGINHILISLNGNDLYDVQFLQVRGATVKAKAKLSDIGCETLKSEIEATTELYLSL